MQLIALAAVVLGVALGYGTGRYLWARRRLVFSLWPIVALLAVASAVLSRVFQMADLGSAWDAFAFPLLVGWGVGLSITPARLPRHGAWWEIWKT